LFASGFDLRGKALRQIVVKAHPIVFAHHRHTISARMIGHAASGRDHVRCAPSFRARGRVPTHNASVESGGGERPTDDAEATRAAILKAAEEIFAQEGFGAARVDAIATRAGYNKSLLFQYFGDKLGLYQAIVKRTKEHLDQQFEPFLTAFAANPGAVRDAEQVREFIATTVRWIFDYYVEHPNFLRILAWEAADGWRTFNQLNTAAEPMRWLQPAEALLRQIQAAHLVRPGLEVRFVVNMIAALSRQYLISLPAYQNESPETDLSSSGALTQAREQIVMWVLNAVMAAPETARAKRAPIKRKRRAK